MDFPKRRTPPPTYVPGWMYKAVFIPVGVVITILLVLLAALVCVRRARRRAAPGSGGLSSEPLIININDERVPAPSYGS